MERVRHLPWEHSLELGGDLCETFDLRARPLENCVDGRRIRPLLRRGRKPLLRACQSFVHGPRE